MVSVNDGDGGNNVGNLRVFAGNKGGCVGCFDWG